MLTVRSRSVAFALTLFAAIPAAYGVDGVILIDQNKALAGNVTPGDTPGFPVSITQPGSYRLATNLTVPAGQQGIVIGAQNVTIDLNGFSIKTPTQPATGGLPFGVTIDGVVVPSAITIRNGTIEGFATPISFRLNSGATFQYCRSCVLQDLLLDWGLPGGSSSVTLGKFARVVNVTAPSQDIQAHCPSLVTQSVARHIDFLTVFTGDVDTNSGTCSFTSNAVEF